MKRLSGRRRLLGGALGLAVAVWILDELTGRDTPAVSQAARSTAAPAAAEALPTAKWEDVGELVGRLTRFGYASVADELEHLERDLFTPAALPETALVTPPETPEAQDSADAPQPDPAVAPGPDFASQHRLLGVLIGQAPLAVIDDRLLPLNAELDGFQLVAIQRDFVVFRRLETGETVVLRLEKQAGPPVTSGGR